MCWGLEDGDDAEAVVVGFEVDYHFFFAIVDFAAICQCSYCSYNGDYGSG